jgi:hypothetical protein
VGSAPAAAATDDLQAQGRGEPRGGRGVETGQAERAPPSAEAPVGVLGASALGRIPTTPALSQGYYR